MPPTPSGQAPETEGAAVIPSPFASVRRRAIELLDARPPLLVVSDFDGTLSAIHPDPLGARIDPLARTALRRLSRLAAIHPDLLRVFVLSGRAAMDVAARVRVGGLTYLGNHGLEAGGLPPRTPAERLQVQTDPALAALESPARALGETVAEALDNPDWLFVELKGPAVAFHFRAAPDPAAAHATVGDALDGAIARLRVTGLSRLAGRRVIEVRPSTAGGKGATLERLIRTEDPGAILVLGDDVSDAEAFRAMAAARQRGRAGLALAVHGAVETPAAVIESADAVLATPHDAARLISAVGRALDRRVRPSARSAVGAGGVTRQPSPRPPSPRRPSPPPA